eukprot:scaffold37518_cov267-Amphora_coffeaeformis.AAC.1
MGQGTSLSEETSLLDGAPVQEKHQQQQSPPPPPSSLVVDDAQKDKTLDAKNVEPVVAPTPTTTTTTTTSREPPLPTTPVVATTAATTLSVTTETTTTTTPAPTQEPPAKSSSSSNNNNQATCDGQPYQFTLFDRLGRILDTTTSTTPTKTCVESVEVLAQILDTKVQDERVAVIALGSLDNLENNNTNHLDTLAHDAVDAFLTPRFDWRIVAERFDGTFSNQLFYDPATLAPRGTGTFAEPASAARQTLLASQKKSLGTKAEAHNDEELLKLYGVDFILVRVLDDTYTALSNALRRFQFPDDEDCSTYDQQNAGRTFLNYGGYKDFLGATTDTNVRQMLSALRAGTPFVNVKPPAWGHTYRFDDCTEDNGIECAFLPMYGGKCLSARVKPSLECLGKLDMGSLERIVLPKNGVPSTLCEEGHAPDAYKKWCPQCGFGAKVQKASPDLVSDPTAALTFGEIAQIGKDLPVSNYVHEQDDNTYAQ